MALYTWAAALKTQKDHEPNGILSFEDSTDDAISVVRSRTPTTEALLTFLRAFNRNINIPDFTIMDAGSIPPELQAESLAARSVLADGSATVYVTGTGTTTGAVSIAGTGTTTGTVSISGTGQAAPGWKTLTSSSGDGWLAIYQLFRILGGATYFPLDSVFYDVFDRVYTVGGLTSPAIYERIRAFFTFEDMSASLANFSMELDLETPVLGKPIFSTTDPQAAGLLLVGNPGGGTDARSSGLVLYCARSRAVGAATEAHVYYLRLRLNGTKVLSGVVLPSSLTPFQAMSHLLLQGGAFSLIVDASNCGLMSGNWDAGTDVFHIIWTNLSSGRRFGMNWVSTVHMEAQNDSSLLLTLNVTDAATRLTTYGAPTMAETSAYFNSPGNIIPENTSTKTIVMLAANPRLRVAVSGLLRPAGLV
jgi:hypothetical protein